MSILTCNQNISNSNYSTPVVGEKRKREGGENRPLSAENRKLELFKRNLRGKNIVIEEGKHAARDEAFCINTIRNLREWSSMETLRAIGPLTMVASQKVASDDLNTIEIGYGEESTLRAIISYFRADFKERFQGRDEGIALITKVIRYLENEFVTLTSKEDLEAFKREYSDWYIPDTIVKLDDRIEAINYDRFSQCLDSEYHIDESWTMENICDSVECNCEVDDITDIHADNIGITRIPFLLREFKNIKVLSLCGNKIKFIPGEIQKLTKLEELSLSSNKIAVVPDEIGKLPALSTLRLDSNKLGKLPRSISKMSHLGKVYINNNPLTMNSSDLSSFRFEDWETLTPANADFDSQVCFQEAEGPSPKEEDLGELSTSIEELIDSYS